MGTVISEETFAGLLDSFTATAFRLECQDHYALGYEAADFDRFLAGHPLPPPQVGWWAPWLERIAEMTAEGKRIARVRIVTEPATPYQRWEMWAAPWHAAAGEEIAYLPRSRARSLGLPHWQDWWLLDGERLILMGFDHTGQITGKVLITNPSVITTYRTWQDLAVRNAVPVEQIAAA